MLNLENQTLGKYDVFNEIGRGSMGIVYLGHDPFAGREVAIKVALPDALLDEHGGVRYRKLFFNEAKVSGMLRHPNIVSVFDAGVEGDICFIVMEYVSGGETLYNYCRPETLLPMEDVVRIAFKCAKALDYAHRKGVVHRDIKPRNILLTKHREVKIGDFSIALMNRADSTETQVHGYVGSPLYMSPEQIVEENIDNQTDLFSMGVVTFELLTGRHPFAADSLPAIIHSITEKAPPPLRELRHDVPSTLAHIVDRCLRKDPVQRYKTGLDLAADLSLVFDHIKLFDEDLPGQEKLNLVRQLKFFDEFTESEIAEVINASTWQDFEPASQIIVEGEMDNSFYIIISGEVVVRKGVQVVDVLHQGHCFGEMGFISNRSRTATIVAKNSVTTMKVRASHIERASLNCQLRFHKIFLNTLIERLSNATERMAIEPAGA